jgi:hypothetical protein
VRHRGPQSWRRGSAVLDTASSVLVRGEQLADTAVTARLGNGSRWPRSRGSTWPCSHRAYTSVLGEAVPVTTIPCTTHLPEAGRVGGRSPRRPTPTALCRGHQPRNVPVSGTADAELLDERDGTVASGRVFLSRKPDAPAASACVRAPHRTPLPPPHRARRSRPRWWRPRRKPRRAVRVRTAGPRIVLYASSPLSPTSSRIDSGCVRTTARATSDAGHHLVGTRISGEFRAGTEAREPPLLQTAPTWLGSGASAT